MKSTVPVQVPTDTLRRLIDHIGKQGGTQDLAEAVQVAIDGWLDRASCPTGDGAEIRGYQWKTLFLPEGTIVRSWSYGEANYARVEGDDLIHMGRKVSPNQFAQSFARSTRNAWTDLLVKRPGDKRYRLACTLRRETDGTVQTVPCSGMA